MCGHSVDLPGNTCSEYSFESHYKGDSNSTHYICFDEEIRKILPQISSNTSFICSPEL